jgi:elongation factor Ts
MAEISAKDIAALRKQSGAGMLDCRTALQETGGDIEAAKDWLRTQGLAGAAKRAGREAQDGAVDVLVEDSVGAAVELNCETDFVAKGADFRTMLAALTKIVAEQGDDDLESRPYEGGTVGDAVKQLGATLGENVAIGRVARVESTDGIVDGYKHIQSERGTIAVLVEVGGVDPSDARAREVAHDIALHIASAAPRFVSRDDVPAELSRGPPSGLTHRGEAEQAVPKIVEGRLNSFYKNCPRRQPFVREPKTTVGKLLGELAKEATVRRFVRIQVGAE